ncbi:MAG: hypothetical protein ACKOQX_09555 [Actinomycetota bacterium]
MSSDIGAKDLVDAARAIELADSVIGKAVRTLAATGGPDEQQVLAYDLARAASTKSFAPMSDDMRETLHRCALFVTIRP